MSPLFEVPAKLALVLQLVSSDPSAAIDIARPDDTPAVAAELRIETEGFALSAERWLEVMREHGEAAGQAHLAARIFRTRNGTLYVPVGTERTAILGARRQASVVLPVARAAAGANAELLSWTLGRRPTPGELLVAHLAEAGEARALVGAPRTAALQPAAELAPKAAAAHRELFFDGERARTSGEVLRTAEVAIERALRRHADRVRTTATSPVPGLQREAASWRLRLVATLADRAD